MITDTIRASEERRVTVEGTFVDRDGNPITKPGDKGKPATVLFDESYSYLIGHNSPIYGTSGLRSKMYNELFYGGADGIGAEIRLTTINDLQEYCYEQLGEYEGSVIVMNANTGELLVCTSRSSPERGYNVNLVDHWVDANEDGEANKDDNRRMYDVYLNTCDGFLLNRAVTAEDPPGSTMKILTTIALLENGFKNYTYDDMDGTYFAGNSKVVNVNGNVYGADVDLTKAMCESVNVFFASAAVEMGSSALLNTAKRFRLTEHTELDFATLRPSFNLGNMTDTALLAHTAYGQGHTKTAPLNLVMIMGAVMNGGNMMKPSLIASITDDGVVERTLEPEILSEAIDPQTASQVLEYLHATALHYGLTMDSYGTVYAKTGTAELGKGRGNHIYMLAGIEDTAWGDLVVLIDRAHVNASSSSIKAAMKNILGVLVAA